MKKQAVFFDRAEAHEAFVPSCGCKILLVKEEDSWGIYYKIAGYSYEYGFGVSLDTPYIEVCKIATTNAENYCGVLFND